MNFRDVIKFCELVSLWQDWWHPDGNMCPKYGFRVIYDTASRFNAKVSSMLKEGNWLRNLGRFEALVESKENCT